MRYLEVGLLMNNYTLLKEVRSKYPVGSRFKSLRTNKICYITLVRYSTVFRRIVIQAEPETNCSEINTPYLFYPEELEPL